MDIVDYLKPNYVFMDNVVTCEVLKIIYCVL